MELSLDVTGRYSFADYLTWLDDVRRELIEGCIKLLPAPKRIHAEVSKNIYRQLDLFVTGNKGNCKVYPAPFDVRLPKNGEKENRHIYNVVQPDICVICDPSKLDEDGCCGAPDMIVEVLSPASLKRDAYEKYILYEETGVGEYWMVHPKDKTVTVFLLQDDGKYNDGIVYETKGKIPIHTFHDYLIDIEELFKF